MGRILRRLLSDIRDMADALFSFSRRLESMPLSTIEKSTYIPILEEYHTLHHELWALGMVPNVLDLENDVMRVYLKDWLRHAGCDDQDVEVVFQALAAPRELSLVQQEQEDMLALARSEQPEDVLKKHWETYRSIQFGWTGPAKVVIGSDECGKVEKGDIIVSVQTVPSFSTAIFKAAGLICDGGTGITSHPATLSREAGIPCVIQTRFMREVVHDGDIVEVDGYKGIARIIERK